jgi:hypothetical protein
MKRALVFLLLAVMFDRGIGAVLGWAQRHTLTGDRGGLTNYALTRDADILVLGSSRAQFHVMPSVLHDKLSASAYNAGLKGQDFLYSDMLFDLWKRRHPFPHVIVMTVDIESFIERETEIPAAQILAPYLDESERVRDVLYSASPFKRWEYVSRTYRFNGNLFSLLKHAFRNPPPYFDGFGTSPGALNPETDTGVLNALDQDETAMVMAHEPLSAKKLDYLRELSSEAAAHGARLVLLHTPLFRQDHAAHDFWVSRLRGVIGSMRAVSFADLCTRTHPKLFSDPALYRNLNHLNERGAIILTSLLADDIAGAQAAR